MGVTGDKCELGERRGELGEGNVCCLDGPGSVIRGGPPAECARCVGAGRDDGTNSDAVRLGIPDSGGDGNARSEGSGEPADTPSLRARSGGLSFSFSFFRSEVTYTGSRAKGSSPTAPSPGPML